MSRKEIVLVTGGAGFIGCNLTNALGSAHGKIIVVDNLHPQIHVERSRPKDLPAHVELIIEDVRNSQFWDEFLVTYEPRIFVHLAAETGTGQSLTLSERHASTNVVGVAAILDAFVRAQTFPKQILLTSSRAVYGEGAWQTAQGKIFYPSNRGRNSLEQAQWDIKGPSGENAAPLPHSAGNTQTLPNSIYGSTKLAQEHLFRSWAAAYGISVSILRLQNVYGAGQTPRNPYTGIVTLFHQVASKNEPIEIFEDGEIGRDFIYIRDVVRACVAAIKNPGDAIRTIDIGTGHPVTVMQMAKIISEIYGSPAPKICGKFRFGDVRWAYADNSEMVRTLEIEPSIDILEGNLNLKKWLFTL